MKKEKGSILIFTLWVLLILAILSIILSYRASTDVKLARYESRNIKATYLARAAIMKMVAELSKDTNSYDSLNEDWNRDRNNPKELRLGDGMAYYGASDEMSRLNLNSSTLKQNQLTALGMEDPIADGILRYLNDKNNKNKKGTKGFEFIEELFLVEGMTQDIYSRIEDLVTIYRGEDSRVNINTASEEVLLAIIGTGLENENLVKDILSYREEGLGPDGIEDTDDISTIWGLDSTLFSVESNVFRIWAEAYFSEDKEISKNVEAIVDTSGTGKIIYHWKEY